MFKLDPVRMPKRKQGWHRTNKIFRVTSPKDGQLTPKKWTTRMNGLQMIAWASDSPVEES